MAISATSACKPSCDGRKFGKDWDSARKVFRPAVSNALRCAVTTGNVLLRTDARLVNGFVGADEVLQIDGIFLCPPVPNDLELWNGVLDVEILAPSTAKFVPATADDVQNAARTLITAKHERVMLLGPGFLAGSNPPLTNGQTFYLGMAGRGTGKLKIRAKLVYQARAFVTVVGSCADTYSGIETTERFSGPVRSPAC